MGADAPWHWVILGVLVIALFGYKKLPDASRALGRSLRIFKTEIKGMSDDDKTRETAATGAVAAAPTSEVTGTPEPSPATETVAVSNGEQNSATE
jgi:sec-independent protein translocase protein TatA